MQLGKGVTEQARTTVRLLRDTLFRAPMAETVKYESERVLTNTVKITNGGSTFFKSRGSSRKEKKFEGLIFIPSMTQNSIRDTSTGSKPIIEIKPSESSRGQTLSGDRRQSGNDYALPLTIPNAFQKKPMDLYLSESGSSRPATSSGRFSNQHQRSTKPPTSEFSSRLSHYKEAAFN